MSMVQEFIDHLRKLVDEEELSDTAKEYFKEDIAEFEKRWIERTCEDPSHKIKGYLAELKDYQETVKNLRQDNSKLKEQYHEKKREVQELTELVKSQAKFIGKLVKDFS